MQNNQVLIGAIRGCSTRNDLETTFDLFKVNDLEARYDTLVEAMYNPQMFFSNGVPDVKQKYELTVEMFLTMEWKLSEMYEKMGIV